MGTSLRYETGTKTINDLVNLFENNQLNLSPAFQRESVWQERDRAKLVDSIIRNYPLPAIFLYRRQDEDGQLISDVIDGKQRLESLLMFVGKLRGKFSTKSQLPESEEIERVDWNLLKRRKLQHIIMGYKIPVVEVDGKFSDIIEVFVRINSTGKALTRAESQHAKYYRSRFLKEAARIARRHESYFSDMRILSRGQLSRMKHIEFICELMISIHQGDVINKKFLLDKIMSSDSLTDVQIRKTSERTVLVLNRVRKMFPKLYSTRFTKLADFYSLTALVSKFESEQLILTDKQRNRLAWDLLLEFSLKVDKLREQQKEAKISSGQEVYREYLLTVQQATDEVNQRRSRERILRSILASLFARKDSQRGFSSEQRRILWNQSGTHKCKGCRQTLSWSNFTIDHIDPHSKGGRSKLNNAAVMCRSCNSSKGKRYRKAA
jgi:5-methylcytosine-specific restriction endonuclease McrA